MSTFRKVGVYSTLLLTLSGVGYNAIKLRESPGGIPPVQAYIDVAGVPTICHGRTRGVSLGMRTTLAQCEYWLALETSVYGNAVSSYVTTPITQGQYDILVDFTYNKGIGAFKFSTLLRRINAGDCYGAAAEFLRWDKAKVLVHGKRVLRPVPGLTKTAKAWAEAFKQECAV